MEEDFSEIYGKILDKQIKENAKVFPVNEKKPEKITISVKESKKEPLEKFLIELQEKLREKLREKQKLEETIDKRKSKEHHLISNTSDARDLTENSYIDELIKIDKTQEKKLIKENEDLSSQIQNLRSQITRLSVEGGTWGGGDIGGGGSIMATSGGSGCSCLTGTTDRLIADTQTLILNSDGTINFPNDLISTPSGVIDIAGDLNVSGRIYQNSNDLQSEIESVSATSQSVYTTVNSNSSYWNSVYTTFKNTSSTFLTSETDSQTLSFNEINKNLSISSGNTISLSSLIQDTSIRSLTSNWQNTYNTVLSNSANWNYQGSDIKALTADWVGGNVAYTNLIANSAAYLGVVDLSFLSVSANWNSVYTTVNTNSAVLWNYQGNDIKALSGTWQDTYSTVLANSASWAVDSTADTGVRALTSNWESTYTTVSSNSANWQALYTTVQTNSSTWFTAGSADRMVARVYNADTVTLNKGNVVYTFGATGDVMSVKRASNVGDETSARTLGFVNETIPVGGIGYVVITGQIDKMGLPQQTYSEGDILWLGSTLGSFTNVKPVAPSHSVYLGVVERANNGDGLAYVKIQNGVELDELHDVLITSVSADQVLRRNSTNNLWINTNDGNKWDSTYTTVQTNSSTNWNYQGTDLKSLSGNWQNTYTNYSSNSASYIKTNTSDTTPVYSIRALTQTQYDAISIKDPNTLYFITT